MEFLRTDPHGARWPLIRPTATSASAHCRETDVAARNPSIIILTMAKLIDLQGATFAHHPADYEAKAADAAAWFQYRSGVDLCMHSDWTTVPFQHRNDLTRSFSQGDPGPLRRWLQTSGTSGRPILSPFSMLDEEHAADTVARVHQVLPPLAGNTAVVGIPSGTSAAGFHASRQLNQVGVAVVHTGVRDPLQLINDIEHTGAKIVLSLPRVACRLAELSQRLYGRLPHLDYMLLVGDIATPARLERVASIWQAASFDCFGMTELFGPCAVQIRPGILQWEAQETLVEVLNPDTLVPCSEGEVGVLVVTSLWHKAMPLFRYWTSDVVRLEAPGPAGEFRFATVGRPLSRVPGHPNVYLSAIDQVVLSADWTGSEWDLTSDEGASVVLSVEAQAADADAMANLLDDLRALGDWDPNLEVVPLGSLPRAHPKFQLA